MSLQSHLLKNDPRLEACLVDDRAHVYEGLQGAFVTKIQYALVCVDGFRPPADEFPSGRFGASTRQAVHAFKAKRGIINYAYETQVDDVVGKMTIARLDLELARLERHCRVGVWK